MKGLRRNYSAGTERKTGKEIIVSDSEKIVITTAGRGRHWRTVYNAYSGDKMIGGYKTEMDAMQAFHLYSKHKAYPIEWDYKEGGWRYPVVWSIEIGAWLGKTAGDKWTKIEGCFSDRGQAIDQYEKMVA